MDIIASHQQGLVEQLEAEAVALAGGPRDAVARAMVAFHVADMAGGHGYALLAAEGSLGLDAALARMAGAARRWRPGSGRAEREALAARVALFGEAMRRIDAERCAGLLMAYRLVATPGLGGEVGKRLARELLDALRAALAARGGADGEVRRALFDAHRVAAEEQFGAAVGAAVEALGWRLRGSLLRTAVEAVLVPRAAFERAERRGLARTMRDLAASRRFAPGFAANPAQAFFELQRHVAERHKRRAGRDGLTPDEAVRLAA